MKLSISFSGAERHATPVAEYNFTKTGRTIVTPGVRSTAYAGRSDPPSEFDVSQGPGCESVVAAFCSRARWLAALRELQYGDSMNEVSKDALSPKNALAEVARSADGLYAVLLENGSMELGYYKPVGVDEQQPHDQDEIYIVQSGSGTFTRDEEQIPFSAGDALFVAAGVKHRFVDFTDDFAAWVVFYGPPGGE